MLLFLSGRVPLLRWRLSRTLQLSFTEGLGYPVPDGPSCPVHDRTAIRQATGLYWSLNLPVQLPDSPRYRVRPSQVLGYRWRRKI